MIAEAEAAGADWRLLYGGRERTTMAFVDELAQYGDRVTLAPQNESGPLDLAAVLSTTAAGHPDLLLRTGRTARRRRGVLRRLAGGHAASRALRAQARGDRWCGGSSFELVLERSGLTLTVPADRSVYEVVKEAGVSVLASCLEGVCGTCETEVIDGEVDHRDSVLNDEEKATNEFMMICVSRCKSPCLTLDL